MLIRMSSPTCNVGQNIVQYFPKQGWVFLQGQITEVSDSEVVADFGDMVMRFSIIDIFYAIDTDMCEEHYSTMSCGTVESDYRKPVKQPI